MNANERQSRRGKRAKRGRAKRGTERVGQLVRKTEDWDGDRCSERPHSAFSAMIQGCSPRQLLSTSHGLGLEACKQDALTRRRAGSGSFLESASIHFTQSNTQYIVNRDTVGCVSERCLLTVHAVCLWYDVRRLQCNSIFNLAASSPRVQISSFSFDQLDSRLVSVA